MGFMASPVLPRHIAASLRTAALEALSTLFNDEEIDQLAFNLLIDHDDIAGKTRSARAQSLIELCERTGRADLLIGHIRRLRPDAALPSQL
jgi:hypothetical protein